MRIYDIIIKKRDGHELTSEEIGYFISAYTSGEVPDYQAASLLMAIFFQGMNHKETALLTQFMTDSGKKLDLGSLPGIKVDKHSTGGVGDGISLVLAPLVAACGVIVPMMSGRGLGHTGGTLDKLASIPNFRVELSNAEMLECLNKINVVMIGQSPELAPADRKLYALRDVTGTVESIPLIAASILSKKFAEGADALVLDIKTGNGAFMRDKKNAVKLGRTMIELGKRQRKRVVALVTDMNQPLGEMIGNSLEIEQAVTILQGKENPRTKSFIELTEKLGGLMLYLGGKAASPNAGQKLIAQARADKLGLETFRALVKMQGGDPRVCDAPQEVLPQAKYKESLVSPWKGWIMEMSALSAGKAALLLGAGRSTKESAIDLSAGIRLHKQVGDRVERGELIADFFSSTVAEFTYASAAFSAGLKIGKVRPRPRPLILDVLK